MTKKDYNVILVILIVLACIVSAALVYLIYQERNQPEPPLIMPTTTPTPNYNDTWERILANGKIVVGTSADYPPFEFYTDDYQLDGLDIALVREIGQKFGVEVEFRDMAFDGLIGALELKQIDLIAAAFSVTPDRETVVDFSKVYYVSDAAVLAGQDFPNNSIVSIDQLAPYRVGVQRGTVFSNLLQEELIETGLMPVTNLYEYQTADEAVADLGAGRIELVLLDLPPAQEAVNNGGFKIVGRSLNTQHFALAVAQDNPMFQAQINNALAQLQNEGRLDALVLQYTGELPAPLPTPGPTPVPLPTATTAPCIDGMQFVADLNLDDHNMTAPPVIPAGQSFTKGWRIKNTGTCNWDSSFKLVYVGGNTPLSSMGGQPTPVVGIVPPGAEYDIWVGMVAPLTPGTYQGFWSMDNAAGQKFGDRIWVGITVPAPPTVTPAPTQTPSPTISFTVDRTDIKAGECVLFRWNVQNAQGVYFYAQGQPWQSYPVAPIGSRSECPTVTTTYNLLVINVNGSQEARQITINVTPVPGAPVINLFTVNPPYEINQGQCVDISWAVQGAITRIDISRGETPIWQGAPVSGTLQDCPPGSGTVTYNLVASGPGGTSRTQRTITVNQSTAPTPTPTAVSPTAQPLPPTIEYYVVQPEEIQAGGCFNISWATGSGTNFVRLTRNGLIILDNGPVSGNEQDCVFDVGPTVYNLTALNYAGQQVSQAIQVNVIDSTSPPVFVNIPWVLDFYKDGSNLVTVLPDTTITATFDAANNLSGSGGCNQYNAAYNSSGSSLTIGAISTTGSSCGAPAGIMQQEQAYFSALPLVTSYVVSGSQLQLRDQYGEVILQYNMAPQPR